MKTTLDSVRDKNVRKRKKAETRDSLFDEQAAANALAASTSSLFKNFNHMNLSRPVLKVNF